MFDSPHLLVVCLCSDLAAWLDSQAKLLRVKGQAARLTAGISHPLCGPNTWELLQKTLIRIIVSIWCFHSHGMSERSCVSLKEMVWEAFLSGRMVERNQKTVNANKKPNTESFMFRKHFEIIWWITIHELTRERHNILLQKELFGLSVLSVQI